MSILTKVGIPILLNAAVKLLSAVVNRFYEYQEKKLLLKILAKKRIPMRIKRKRFRRRPIWDRIT